MKAVLVQTSHIPGIIVIFWPLHGVNGHLSNPSSNLRIVRKPQTVSKFQGQSLPSTQGELKALRLCDLRGVSWSLGVGIRCKSDLLRTRGSIIILILDDDDDDNDGNATRCSASAYHNYGIETIGSYSKSRLWRKHNNTKWDLL